MSRRRYRIMTPDRLEEEAQRRAVWRKRYMIGAGVLLVLVVGAVILRTVLRDKAEAKNLVATVEASRQAREYLVHLPPNYSRQSEYPVVIVFHGYLQSHEKIRDYTRFNDLADQEGIIAVYPLGFLHLWEVDDFDQTQVDDLEFVEALLDVLENDFAVDPQRIYAAGFSQGGAFSHRLACEMPDRIAAIGAVGATVTSDLWVTCDPSRPVPVVMFHGTADPVVPYLWTVNDFLLSVPELAAGWAEKDGCGPAQPDIYQPDITDDGMRVRLTAYDGCDAGAEVLLYTIEGGSHTWPGAAPLPDVISYTSRDIDANTVLWEFFSRHPLP